MNPQIIRIVDQYLTGELSAEDKIIFEERLKSDSALQHEVNLQRGVMESSKRAAQRQLIKQAGKRYHFRKTLINSAILVAVVAGLTAATVAFVAKRNQQETKDKRETITKVTKEKLNTDLFFPDLAVDRKMLNSTDTVIFMSDGTMLSIPGNAFLLDGKEFRGRKIIQYQVARNAADIIKSGLSTTSDGKLLETGGMFSLNGYTSDGRKLQVNPKVGVYVEFPVNGPTENMQLFEGKVGKDEMVNWINPKPLERKPVSASMANLNFYPPGYEAKLNELKWKKGKSQRDSLYLSFEDREDLKDTTAVQVKKSVSVASKEIPRSVNAQQGLRANTSAQNLSVVRTSSTSAVVSFDIRIPQSYELYSDLSEMPGSNNLNNIAVNTIRPIDGSFYSRSTLYSDLPLGSKRAFQRKNGVYHLQQQIEFAKNTDKIQFDICLFPCNQIGVEPISINSQQLVLNREKQNENQTQTQSLEHIPPSKVLAFWNPKFDNTILATKDFEKRMAAIHKTCNPLVLSMYLKNLNSELWKTDERVAKMGYPEFSAFAAERVGKVDLTDEHQQNLKEFFDTRLNEIRLRAKNDKSFAKELEEAYNKQLNGIRADQSLKDAQRWNQNFGDEWELNYVDCLHQLGKKRPVAAFTITSGSPVYNLDRFVTDQTLARSSGKFYDKETGKTAEICYDPLSLEITAADKYQKLFVYLLPDKLHSFERVPVSDGKASYNLNRLISYKAVVVGIDENNYYLEQIGKVASGNIGNISLTKTSEAELDKILNGLDVNRVDKPAFGSTEIDWLRAERQDFKVQRLRMEQAKFRRTLLPIIYPCTRTEAGIEYDPTVVDSTDIEI